MLPLVICSWVYAWMWGHWFCFPGFPSAVMGVLLEGHAHRVLFPAKMLTFDRSLTRFMGCTCSITYSQGVSNTILGNSGAVQSCWVFSCFPAWFWSLFLYVEGNVLESVWVMETQEVFGKQGYGIFQGIFDSFSVLAIWRKLWLFVFIYLVLWELRQKRKRNSFRKWLVLKFKTSCFLNIHLRVQRI